MSTLEEYVTGLDVLRMKFVPTHYSPGARERAHRLAVMADKSYAFLREFYKADVDVALLVLNSEDWSRRTHLPYGVLYSEMGVVHLTADIETPAIESLSPIYENCSEALKKSVTSAVGHEEAAFAHGLQILFDYLTVHEFTHAFQEKRRVRFGAYWLQELFANYATYAFVKRFEAEYGEDLRLVETLAKAVYEGGRPLVRHTSLEDFERLYARVGFLNYAWYHGKFFVGVVELYSRYGESFMNKLIDMFEVKDDALVRQIDRSCREFEQWFEVWRQES